MQTLRKHHRAGQEDSKKVATVPKKNIGYKTPNQLMSCQKAELSSWTVTLLKYENKPLTFHQLTGENPYGII
ncbi:hypothetical protein GCM10027180_03190 [Microbulbifer echini]